MTLFPTGDFTFNAGGRADWKIECDALTGPDWTTLARLAASVLQPFDRVEGVLTGGERFANALVAHRTPGAGRLLIADDVSTTGGSLERQRDGREAVGIVVFDRTGECPPWVTALFTYTGTLPRLGGT